MAWRIETGRRKLTILTLLLFSPFELWFSSSIFSVFDCLTLPSGGHWYNSEVLEADPWATVGYLSTNTEGYAQFATCVSTGFDLASDPDQLIGHAFIVHANDGSRASCGVITEAPTDYIQPDGMKAEMTPIPGVEDTNSTMAGEVTIMMGFQGISDATCYMGYAMGLEPSVESFMMGTGSDECDVPNGCGAHIHSGTGCEDKDAQGGHYFDKDTIGEDPWKVESYYETDSVGETALFGCAITGQGAKEYESKPFIVHNTLGGRVLCGMIEIPATEVYEPPSGSATKSVVAAFTSMLLVLALF